MSLFQWVAYDVQNGHIQFEMTIPTRMEDINLMAIKSDLKNRLDIFINHMSQYHWNMREMFYMYRPRVGQILPPFDGKLNSAMLQLQFDAIIKIM